MSHVIFWSAQICSFDYRCDVCKRSTFLVTLSRRILLFTVEFLLSRTSAQIIIQSMKVFRLYARSGFSIRTILMDQEFDKVLENMPEIKFNTAAAQEHVR